MKSIIIHICLFTLITSVTHAQNIQPKKATLPNGWTLSPAGRSLPLGDLPLNIAVSKSKK
jgi:hypothetical protein